MKAPASLTKAQIRKRDGDACWLCTRPMDFTAKQNSRNAPTIEHLEAKSLGGGGEADNLALCHQKCNAHLKDRPLDKKLKMRDKWHANALKGFAPKSKPTAKVANSPSSKNVAPIPQAQASPKLEAEDPLAVRAALQQEVSYWRRLALISTGTALVSLGFALGLSVALLTQ